MINAAMVGLGRWGQTILNSVQGKSTRLRIVHGVSKEPELARELAARHDFRLSADLEDAIADPGVQAIILATPHSLGAGAGGGGEALVTRGRERPSRPSAGASRKKNVFSSASKRGNGRWEISTKRSNEHSGGPGGGRPTAAKPPPSRSTPSIPEISPNSSHDSTAVRLVCGCVRQQACKKGRFPAAQKPGDYRGRDTKGFHASTKYLPC